METLLASAEAIFVLIGIGAVGFFVIAKKILPADTLRFLSTLAIEVALPLYVFTNLVDNFDPASAPGWWLLPLLWMLFAVVTFFLSVLFSKLFKKDNRREAAASLYLYNPVFVPLSILIGVYGNDSPYIADLFLFTMFAATFYFNFYPYFFRDPGERLHFRKASIDWKKLFNPLIKATLLALIFTLTGLNRYIPGAIISVTRYIGALSFTLIMFILGGYIYIDMKNAGKIYFAEAIKYVAVKNFVFPLIALAAVWLLRPSFNIALILVLSAAAPPLSTIPILVQRQNGNTQLANQFLVGSFLFSILSIPLMVMLLNALYA